MNGARHQFLAGTGFSREQHVDRAVQHLADQLVDRTHARAVTDQAVTAGAGTDWRGNWRGATGRAQALEQMQLGEAEGAELGQRAAEAVQLARFGTGRQQQAGDALLLVLQRQAEQAAPGAGLSGRKLEACRLLSSSLRHRVWFWHRQYCNSCSPL